LSLCISAFTQYKFLYRASIVFRIEETTCFKVNILGDSAIKIYQEI